MNIRIEEIKRYTGAIIGGVLFAIGVNLFLVPLNLYSGGIIGIAQIIRTILLQYLNFSLGSFDIAGMINFVCNIPLFILAYKSLSYKFFIRTLLCVIAQTITFSFVPIPSSIIIQDVLTSCIIAGLITGFGIGLALRSMGCGGGLDILGVYLSKKTERISVGKLALIVNVVVYGVCAFLFNVQTAIYSVIYMFIFSIVVDKTHYQNINMSVMIFTKNKQVQQEIMKQTGRGVTYWKGAGAYTDTETLVLVTIINKYEVNQIKKIIYTQDPQAFVICYEGMSVSGNFERRLS